MRIVDNGVGFDPTAVERKGRIGLVAMRDRAEAIGAQLNIGSVPGQGYHRGTALVVEALPTVVIADDHVPTRDSVRRVLEDDGFEVVAAVGDAEDAIRACRDMVPAVAILDVRMPGNGVRAAEIIKTERPSVEVLMLTISDEDVDLFASLAAGASGYWLKGKIYN